MFAVEFLSGADGVDSFNDLVPPMISARLHVNFGTSAAKDDNIFDRRTLSSGLIDHRFEFDLAPTSIAAVGGDDQFAAAIDHAVANRIG